MASSPWRDGGGDIVAEVADACRAAGLKFGVYLSPWDRNAACYGDSPAYNAFFKTQLRELLTGYGPVFSVWFDGACGEGPNGKRQQYDWAGYYDVAREFQPDAVISICGPDIDIVHSQRITTIRIGNLLPVWFIQIIRYMVKALVRCS